MCGIAGIFGPGAARREDLLSMLRTVRSRGETDETHFGDGYCVGTRRLKIVDRERAIQPIWNERRDKLVIFNGEIFNYKAIKAQLEPRHTFTTDSDTETILHAYEEYGPRCVERFDGQFAFAIYDVQRRALFAARDAIGIVPLYCVRTRDTLYVASIVKALTYLGASIQALPPGHTLDIDGNLEAYYRPRYQDAALDEEAFVARLKAALQAAVAKRVDTDLPVGVIYSGGIDSSVVLREAVRNHDDVTAFTIGSRDSADFQISQRYCQEEGIRQVLIPLQRKDLQRDSVKQAIRVTELNEYLDVINAVVSLPLFARIHEEGIKVVLGGDGSDELFGGYEMYREVGAEDEAKLRLHNLMSLHNTELQRVDRCSMEFEVEARVPFLDLDVVDLALQMPLAWKVRDGVEKWAVRQAFRDELPAYILARPKHGLSYSSGLHEWVRMYKPLYGRYYNSFGYDLHAPMKMDFSYVLARNGFDFDRAVEQDGLDRDYPRWELAKEAAKAAVRTLFDLRS